MKRKQSDEADCTTCGKALYNGICKNACTATEEGARVRRRVCVACKEKPEDSSRWGVYSCLCRPCALILHDDDDECCQFCAMPLYEDDVTHKMSCHNGCLRPGRYGNPHYRGVADEFIYDPCAYCGLPLAQSVEHSMCPTADRNRTYSLVAREDKLLELLEPEFPDLTTAEKKSMIEAGFSDDNLRRMVSSILSESKIEDYVTQKLTVSHRGFSSAAICLLKRALYIYWSNQVQRSLQRTMKRAKRKVARSCKTVQPM